jgi:DNA processing protein
MEKELFYLIALSLVPTIGPIGCKRIVQHLGSAERFFSLDNRSLLLKGIPHPLLAKLNRKILLKQAEEELAFIANNSIQVHTYLDENYPKRLKPCADGPVVLYGKGRLPLNAKKILSIVGTRNATIQGKRLCQLMIEELATTDVVIVSGLAYGIDACAHNNALQQHLPTIAVLAHGLNRMYPQAHRALAKEMLATGGLISDFNSQSPFHPGNFPARNRIVAGLSDAVLVIESAEKGGSLITADIANSYHRDVFALPGRATDTYSKGCNALIKENKALLIESAKDLLEQMNWVSDSKPNYTQQRLWQTLNLNETTLVQVFERHPALHRDEIQQHIALTTSQIAEILLGLELKGVISALPGNRYRLN